MLQMLDVGVVFAVLRVFCLLGFVRGHWFIDRHATGMGFLPCGVTFSNPLGTHFRRGSRGRRLGET